MVKKKKSKTLKRRIRVIAGAITGVVFVAALLVVPMAIFQNTAKPGTELFGVDLSYKNAEEINEIISQRIEEFIKKPQEIIVEGRRLKVPLKEVNLEINIPETLSQIEYITLNKAGLTDVFGNLNASKKINPYIGIDEELLIQKLKKEIGAESVQNANIRIDQHAGLSVLEGKSGLEIKNSKLLSDIHKNLLGLRSQKIAVETFIKEPDVKAADLLAQMEDIEKKLTGTKTLISENKEFKLQLVDYPDWVSFGRDEKGIKIKISRAGIEEFVDAVIKDEVEYEAENAEISRDEQGLVIFNGTVSDGRVIQRILLAQILELAVNENVDTVKIPTKTMHGSLAASENLQKLGIKELIGVGHTTFYGSTMNRIHNIRTGIQKYNGLLIAPGETFSFNDHLGKVDASTGYLQELTIKPEGTLPEYGGGLCQVSTTIYRAALFSGLPIVEREPHSYAVSYYTQLLGYGLDATVYPGVHDVKFINDTPGHIVIQAYADGMHAYYKFYGTSDGRGVTLEGPFISNHTKAPEERIEIETDELPPGEEKQTERPHNGFDVLWKRYIGRADGSMEKEEIFTRYQAVPEKVKIGKKTEPQTEEPN